MRALGLNVAFCYYPAMRNLKLTLEYDGTDFHGWQVQPGCRTVQGELYRIFGEFKAGQTRITGAGRTDAGVHAVGQVASVKIDTCHGTEVILRALNAKLPRDIVVKSVEDVPLSFSARFDAVSRTYNYIFILRQTALWKRYYYYVKGGLDTDAMRRVLKELEGERDFASFENSGDDTGTMCRITGTGIYTSYPLVTMSVTADHFLYNMVRNIAGTVLQAGKGRDIDIRRVIESKNRAAAGPTLPPYALYFMKVGY